eukprot:scaffold24563_cov43-Cyclotella_meneghiniana.AAC.3
MNGHDQTNVYVTRIVTEKKRSPDSELFLGGPLEKRVLCGGRDCSSPRRPIRLALQPWPSTTIAVVLAPPRQHIRTVGLGAENRSMCITLLVSTARFVTETDHRNVLSRRC